MDHLPHPLLALLPLLVVGASNLGYTQLIPELYGPTHSFVPAVVGDPAPVVQDVQKITAIWAVMAALLPGDPRTQRLAGLETEHLVIAALGLAVVATRFWRR